MVPVEWFESIWLNPETKYAGTPRVRRRKIERGDYRSGAAVLEALLEGGELKGEELRELLKHHEAKQIHDGWQDTDP